MADADSISILSQPAKAWDALKEAFKCFSELKLGDGLSDLSKLGGDVIAGVVGGIAGYLIFDVLKNPNLKLSQKILPTIGYSCALIISVPLTISLIAGFSILIPPLMFAGSVACFIQSIGTFIEERAERNNLRRELLSKEALINKINKAGLTENDQEKLLSFIFEQRDIYQSLYDLRQSIIVHPNITYHYKQKLVHSLNNAIEGFSQGTIDKLKLDLNGLLEQDRPIFDANIHRLNTRISKYLNACSDVQEMKLPKALLKSINKYKLTREKIYSQDLPLAVKETVERMAEGKKLSKRDLNDLYLRIGNHFLNTTPGKQLKIQDDAILRRILKYVNDKNQIKNITEFFQAPRAIYTQLQSLREKMGANAQADGDLKHIIEMFKLKPSDSAGMVDNINQFTVKYPEYSQLFNKIKLDILQYGVIADNFKQSALHERANQIKTAGSISQKETKRLKNIERLIKSVKDHQVESLNQHANQYGQQFESPRVKFDLKKNDLIAQSGISSVASKVADKLKASSKSVKKKALKKLQSGNNRDQRDDLKGTIDEEKSFLQSEFKERYGSTFDIMGKVERLHFLNKAVPRRMVNIGLSAGVALLSLATTFVIPAVASPAAPAAAAAGVVLGIISTVFTVSAGVNSIDLTRKNLMGKYKIGKAKSSIKESVIPGAAKEYKDKTRVKDKLDDQTVDSALENYRIEPTERNSFTDKQKKALLIIESNMPILQSLFNMLKENASTLDVKSRLDPIYDYVVQNLKQNPGEEEIERIKNELPNYMRSISGIQRLDTFFDNLVENIRFIQSHQDMLRGYRHKSSDKSDMTKPLLKSEGPSKPKI